MGGEKQIKTSVGLIRFLILILLVGLVFPAEAQYVRQNHFTSEHDRRLQYALDDWVSYLEVNRITSVAVGSSYLYFATLDGGILRYQLYQNYWDYPFTTSNGLPSNRVLKIAYDEKNSLLWARTDREDAVFRFGEQEWESRSEAGYWPYEFPSDPPRPTGKDLARNYFFPREELGRLPLYFANSGYTLTGEWKVMDENFEEYPVQGFIKDYWERIWFVIGDLGIGLGSTFSQRFDVLPLGLTHIHPRAIAYQGGDLWIGGVAADGYERSGIVHWRDGDGGWEYYRSRWISELPSDNVADIAVQGDSVWFAIDYGVTLLNSRTRRWKNFDVRAGLLSYEVNDLLLNGEWLYAATTRGLNAINRKTEIVKRVKDDAILLADVHQVAAQADTLWAATNRGILRRPGANRPWQTVATTAAIQDIPVYAVHTFGKEVWFTSPEGVFYLDTRSGRWTSYPLIGPEIEGPYRDLAVNREAVFVSSENGLLKLDRRRGDWLLFTTEDGLLDNRCHRLLLDGDYLWIATESGITQFYWKNPARND